MRQNSFATVTEWVRPSAFRYVAVTFWLGSTLLFGIIIMLCFITNLIKLSEAHIDNINHMRMAKCALIRSKMPYA